MGISANLTVDPLFLFNDHDMRTFGKVSLTGTFPHIHSYSMPKLDNIYINITI
jgi:hypothetical protein